MVRWSWCGSERSILGGMLGISASSTSECVACLEYIAKNLFLSVNAKVDNVCVIHAAAALFASKSANC